MEKEITTEEYLKWIARKPEKKGRWWKEVPRKQQTKMTAEEIEKARKRLDINY